MEQRQKRMVLQEQTFSGVRFENYPSYIDEDGEVIYSLMDGVVADRIAEKIPLDIRTAVKVDWSMLNVEKLKQEAKDELGIKSPFKTREEAKAAEQQLLKLIFGKSSDEELT